MTFKKRSSGAWADIATTLNRMVSSTWVEVDLVRRSASSVWTTVWKRIVISYLSSYALRPSGTSTAQYTLKADGTIWATTSSQTPVQVGTWILFGTPGNYEVKATTTSGTLGSGTVGSWVALTSDRTWTISVASLGTNDAQFTLEIRNTATLVVVDTQTISITAERV